MALNNLSQHSVSVLLKPFQNLSTFQFFAKQCLNKHFLPSFILFLLQKVECTKSKQECYNLQHVFHTQNFISETNDNL